MLNKSISLKKKIKSINSKIANKLVKKFILNDICSNDDYTDIEIYLDNFHFFNSKLLKIRINQSNFSFETIRETANIIRLRVENKNLLNKGSIDLEFIYNRKKLWITYSKNLTNTFILNDCIYSLEKFNYILRLSKYENYLKTYNHSIQVKNIVKEENQLLLNTEYNIDSLILLNVNAQFEIPIYNNKLSLSELSKISPEGKYSIFVAIKKSLYPLEITNTQILSHLTTQQEWVGNQLKINFKKLNVQNLFIQTLLNDSNIKISFEINENDFDHYHLSYLCLVENDLTYFNPQKLETIANKNKIITKINLNDFNNVKKKKLAIVFEDKLNGKQIFYILNTKNKVSFKGSFTFNNKLYNLNIKKQKGITLLTSKPKIKSVVNFITDDLISCHLTYANIHEVFSTYITFEDRESQNKYELPIYKGEQSIEIPYDELEKLSTSSKNIIDIFLSTYDGKTLLQKEKIRYTDGIYKKDNYLSFKCIEKENQKSYYMITLTPFKNLKIENFNLTNDEFQILENGKKSNDIWLIGERRDTAQDNGITFFKWLQNHTHIDAYYVIDSHSNDFKKIKHLPNVLSFASKEHFEVASKANVLISTHDLENIVPYKTAARFWGYEDTIKVFLQHGVLGRKKVEYDKKYYDFPFNLFNVSSTYEKKEVVMKQLGYHDDEVAVTGLPRFDHLPQKNTNEIKKILIMPTWRDWLNSTYAFDNSDYMKHYLSLINSPKLQALINEYDIEINFYPHYRSQMFFKSFLTDNKSDINYIELGDKTVQELLVEHDLLITDYSSVSFDFSYMKKPVIFYHFDVKKFFRKGILRSIKDTFIGDIAHTEKELISLIEDNIKNPKNMEYQNLSSIFDYTDHHNNQRVYHSILDLIQDNTSS